MLFFIYLFFICTNLYCIEITIGTCNIFFKISHPELIDVLLDLHSVLMSSGKTLNPQIDLWILTPEWELEKCAHVQISAECGGRMLVMWSAASELSATKEKQQLHFQSEGIIFVHAAHTLLNDRSISTSAVLTRHLLAHKQCLPLSHLPLFNL